MTLALNKTVRQLAAVALLLVALVLGVAITVLPLANYIGGLQTGIADERALLGRLRAFAANKDKAQQMAAETDEAMRAGLFLTGDTDAVRAANLQAHLTRVAQAQGVRLRSARALPPTEREALRFIGIQVELDTGAKQLQAIIAAFETMRPRLFIQSLQIAPHDQQGNGSDELKVRMGVVGAVPASGKGAAL